MLLGVGEQRVELFVGAIGRDCHSDADPLDRPNQVWAADITYIPLGRGFLYLVAILDWASRAVLTWRLSNTMDTTFCVDALDEALARFGKPEIFNTDQGSHRLFTTVI